MKNTPKALGKEEEFSKDTLQKYLKTKIFGQRIEFLPKANSTQVIANDLAGKGAQEGLVVVADEQMMGRGRGDHQWDSPKGVNLYFSLIFRPESPTFSLSRVNEIQFMAAVGAAKALEELCGLKVELKWPNDIWLKGKKMGGIILTTTAPNPEKVKYIILGMGLNLNTSKEHFSYEVRDLATSVFLQTGKKVNRPFFFAGLLKELESLYLELQSQGFEKLRKKWHHYAPKMCDHEVKLLNVIAQPGNQQLEVLRGQAKGIDAQGHLRVENEQGQELQILDGELQYQ